MNADLIRALQESDLQAVTRLHFEAFPKSALGLLGASAVTRYYQWLMQGPHDAVALGIFQGQSLAGFCFAGVFRGALSGFLQKNRLFLTWRVLTHPWLAATPIFRERLNLAVAKIRHKPERNAASQPALPAKSFGILSIAIAPQRQGGGLGKRLIAEAEAIAVSRGFVHLHLTVAVDNFQAIAFYEKTDWQKCNALDGVWRGVMLKRLGNDHDYKLIKDI